MSTLIEVLIGLGIWFGVSVTVAAVYAFLRSRGKRREVLDCTDALIAALKNGSEGEAA